MAGIKRRSTRQAATRKAHRSIYAEPDTDDDFEAESNGERDFEPEEREAPAPKRRKTASRHKPHTRSSARSKQTSRPLKSVFRVGKPRRINSKVAAEKKKEFSGASDNKVPRWISLPVSILRDIFVYASQPINDYTTAESGTNVSWLLRASRTCRAFALPALEAYYQSPSLLTSLQPHHFLDLLRMPKDVRYIDYNVKVQSLQLHVRTLAYVAHNRPSFDLTPLVAQLPQLQHMEILHPRYLPPYRPLKLQRWTFSPRELFEAMDQRRIRLKSWRWSRDMIPKHAPLDVYSTMSEAHVRQVFTRLQRLTVCGFNYEDSSEPTADENAFDSQSNAISLPPGLATSICALPSLQDLTFISCDVIMDKFLLRLPANLQRLELSNCLEITSDMMRAFFKTSASQLRELVLNHNAALSLSFLTELRVSCPRLEVLRVDLHYYSEKVTINDAEAFYENLLTEEEIPTWPSSLKEIVIVHAQKWSPEAAQNLFRSLLDSAPELSELRHLVIHAHINIPWRDRVGFRDQWIERLRHVYLRKSKQPLPYLGSFRQFRLWKQLQEKDELGEDHRDNHSPFMGTFSHVQISPHKPSGDTEVYTDSDVSSTRVARQPRRSKRVADTLVSHVSRSATEVSETESETEIDQEDWRKQPEKFVQGMCNIVDIRIDNQRPRENQFTEGDFLDSEMSGDEDWHEEGDSEPDTYAW